MSRDDWFRNRKWDAATEAHFLQKLSRARDDVEQFVEVLFSNGTKRNKFAYPSMSENNIDSPGHFGDSLVQAIEVSRLSHVALNARNVGSDCLHRLVEFLLTSARDEDMGALLDEKLCRGQTNPLRASSNHCYFSFQLLSFGHR